MKFEDAVEVAGAIRVIQAVLDQYPDDEDRSIRVDVSMDSDEQNFFVSKLEDLVEIGLPVWVREWWAKDEDYPFEAYVYLSGVEIRTICSQADLDRCGFGNARVRYPDGSTG